MTNFCDLLLISLCVPHGWLPNWQYLAKGLADISAHDLGSSLCLDLQDYHLDEPPDRDGSFLTWNVQPKTSTSHTFSTFSYKAGMTGNLDKIVQSSFPPGSMCSKSLKNVQFKILQFCFKENFRMFQCIITWHLCTRLTLNLFTKLRFKWSSISFHEHIHFWVSVLKISILQKLANYTSLQEDWQLNCFVPVDDVSREDKGLYVNHVHVAALRPHVQPLALERQVCTCDPKHTQETHTKSRALHEQAPDSQDGHVYGCPVTMGFSHSK